MSRIPIAAFAAFLIGCATTERIVPAPVVLPEEGAMVPYGELLPKLRLLAWQVNEAFYRDDWKEVSETAQSVAKAARLLKVSKDAPARLQPELAAKCDALIAEAGQIRAAAQIPDADQIGAHLQKLHNLIRELRPDV